MSYDYEYVSSYVQRIVDWNVRAGNAPKTDNDSRFDQIVLQTNLISEELEELVSAIKEDNLKEQFDAVCDLIVVGSYLVSLTNTPLKYDEIVQTPMILTDSYATGLDEENPPVDRLLFILGSTLIDANVEVKILVGTVVAITQSLWHVYARDHGEDKLRAYMESVLSTNDAKFVEGYEAAVAGLPDVKEKYKGRFENIVVSKCPATKGDITEHYCYRSDHGKGKILKPTGWKEPSVSFDI